jgi:hypothetical protein
VVDTTRLDGFGLTLAMLLVSGVVVLATSGTAPAAPLTRST